jgi:nucleotide-binding universal stress UspA family protein
LLHYEYQEINAMTVIATASKPVQDHLQLETRRLSFRSILAATDLSEEGTSSIKLAADLAFQYRSQLYVVHAVPPQIYVPRVDQIEATRKDLERIRYRLHAYNQDIPELRKVEYEEMVVCASPQTAIATTVISKKIDLLVVGSHGRQGVPKLALGSIAEWSIRHVHCPILVAAPKWNHATRERQSILFATSLRAESLRPAQYASSLAQEYNAELTLLHVVSPDDPEFGSVTEQQNVLAKLHQLLPQNASDWCTPRFEVLSGEVANVVEKVASAIGATMIILGARVGGPLSEHAPWGILSKIIAEARCPVLVVPTHSA